MRILVVDDYLDDISTLTRAIKKTMNVLATEKVVSPYYLLRSEANAQKVFSHVFSANMLTLDSKLLSSSVDSSDSSNSSSLSCGACYDLIFMDTDMPGVKGYDLCRSILDECDARNVERIHVLGMSGRNEESVFTDWRQAGAKGFFEKDVLFGLRSTPIVSSLYFFQGKSVLEGVIRNYVSTVEKDEYRACSKTSTATVCGAPCSPHCPQSVVTLQ